MLALLAHPFAVPLNFSFFFWTFESNAVELLKCIDYSDLNMKIVREFKLLP